MMKHLEAESQLLLMSIMRLTKLKLMMVMMVMINMMMMMMIVLTSKMSGAGQNFTMQHLKVGLPWKTSLIKMISRKFQNIF